MNVPSTISIQEAEAELYRRSLPDFIRAAWPHVVPDQALSWNWHHEVICDVLKEVAEGKLKKVIINIPPGCTKTLLCSVMLNAWEWARDPSLRYLCCSYEQSVAIKQSLYVRRLVGSPWYQGLFGVELAKDQAAKTRFDTTAMGTRVSTSVGGLGTGEHPDRIVIDDPLKAQGSRSDAEMEECREWFDRAISTRTNRNPAFIVVMQRLHEDDLTGHLLRHGGWEHVMLPMEYDPERPDPRDRRLHAGDLLWPSFYDRERVEDGKIPLGSFGVAGQYQQHPVPEGGGLFRRSWFPVSPLPSQDTVKTRVRGWDTASTKDGGDWTVGVLLWETYEGLVYVVDVIREQMDPGDVHNLIVATAGQDGARTAIMEDRPSGGAGKDVGAFRAKALSGFNYESVPTGGKGKPERADAFRAQAQSGNVRVLADASWLNAYLDVMCSFPVGKHDDDVDATAVAFNYLSRSKYDHITQLAW